MASQMQCLKPLSVLIGLLSICIIIIHNSGPYLPLQCVVFSMSCPIAKSYGTITDDQSTDSIHLKPLKQIMQQWVRDGHSIGTQLSVFINNKERLNIFAKDDRKYPNFDRNSLIPVFSTSKNFGALLIAVAVQNKWIKSYDDAVTDYWPQFPTQRLSIPFDVWLQYYDEYSSNKSNINYHTLAQFCNVRGIHIDIKPYRAKIKDVLRHESGYGLVLSTKDIIMNTTTYDDIKSMIENAEYLIHYRRTHRDYHTVTRGYILNQIFMNVEPKHRSMNDYYKQEIVTQLSDDQFVLLFDGLKHNEKYINNMYHIKQQPTYWMLYHVLLPVYLGFKRPFNDVFDKQLCPSLVLNASLCSKVTLSGTKVMLDNMGKLPMGRYPEWDSLASTYALSKTFMGDLQMGYMSLSLVSNAYSMAKTVSHILFSGNVLDTKSILDMISEPMQALDARLGFRSVFSQGGFNLWRFQGIDWYGWGGWGGAAMLFAPQYKCVVAFTVTAFNSPHYPQDKLPRVNTVMNLISMQLVKDNDNAK